MHDPRIADGLEGSRAEFPHLRTEVKRTFAEGDHVIAHVHGGPGATVFRGVVECAQLGCPTV